MHLQDAIKSGKLFRRPFYSDSNFNDDRQWLIRIEDRFPDEQYMISESGSEQRIFFEDLMANDWEIKLDSGKSKEYRVRDNLSMITHKCEDEEHAKKVLQDLVEKAEGSFEFELQTRSGDSLYSKVITTVRNY